MHARPWLVMVVLLGLLLGTAPSALAGAMDDGPRSADLDGKPIPLISVGEYHCHDLDFPVIHCFRTAEARDVALGAVRAPAGATAAAAAVVYVTFYEHSSYGGASIAASQDYDILATIGWNDRISSYKGRNSETGRFYVDWFGGGANDSFCCNQWVSSLGSFNDAFSSVYRT